jgi:TIR domain
MPEKTMNDFKLNAMISYSHDDAATAKRFKDLLERFGCNITIDEHDMYASQEVESAMLGMVVRCHALVFLASLVSVASHYCQKELYRAEELKKPIIVVVLQKGAKNSLPDFLTHRLYIELGEHTEEFCAALTLGALYQSVLVPLVPPEKLLLPSEIVNLPDFLPNSQDAETLAQRAHEGFLKYQDGTESDLNAIYQDIQQASELEPNNLAYRRLERIIASYTQAQARQFRVA